MVRVFSPARNVGKDSYSGAPQRFVIRDETAQITHVLPIYRTSVYPNPL
jgi:hypothetical protein